MKQKLERYDRSGSSSSSDSESEQNESADEEAEKQPQPPPLLASSNQNDSVISTSEANEEPAGDNRPASSTEATADNKQQYSGGEDSSQSRLSFMIKFCSKSCTK